MAFNLPNLRRNFETTGTRNKNDLVNIFDNFINDFYSPAISSFQRIKEELSPRINISETDSDYYIDVELPGIDRKDIELKLDNNILTIKGIKEEKSEIKERNYYTRESYYGTFQRSISIPSSMHADDIEAKLENGILHIKIAKKQQENVKKIEIKS